MKTSGIHPINSIKLRFAVKPNVIIPSEVLDDILKPLSRWTLDDVQIAKRRLLHAITTRMVDVCLREIDYANFDASEGTGRWYLIDAEGRNSKTSSDTAMSTAHRFTEFIRELQSATVTYLRFEGKPHYPRRRENHSLHNSGRSGLIFTPELAELIL